MKHSINPNHTVVVKLDLTNEFLDAKRIKDNRIKTTYTGGTVNISINDIGHMSNDKVLYVANNSNRALLNNLVNFGVGEIIVDLNVAEHLSSINKVAEKEGQEPLTAEEIADITNGLVGAFISAMVDKDGDWGEQVKQTINKAFEGYMTNNPDATPSEEAAKEEMYEYVFETMANGLFNSQAKEPKTKESKSNSAKPNRAKSKPEPKQDSSKKEEDDFSLLGLAGKTVAVGVGGYLLYRAGKFILNRVI